MNGFVFYFFADDFGKRKFPSIFNPPVHKPICICIFYLDLDSAAITDKGAHSKVSQRLYSIFQKILMLLSLLLYYIDVNIYSGSPTVCMCVCVYCQKAGVELRREQSLRKWLKYIPHLRLCDFHHKYLGKHRKKWESIINQETKIDN